MKNKSTLIVGLVLIFCGCNSKPKEKVSKTDLPAIQEADFSVTSMLKDTDGRETIDQARKFWNSGKPEKGVKILEAFLKIQPKNARVLATLGEFAPVINEYDKAENALKKALELGDARTKAYASRLLGAVYYYKNKPDLALEYLNNAMESGDLDDINKAQALFDLSNVYLQQKKFGIAKEKINQAIKLSSDNPVFKGNLETINEAEKKSKETPVTPEG